MGIGGVGMQAAGNILQQQLNPQNQVDKAKAEAYLKGFKGEELSPWEKAVTGYDPEAAELRKKEMAMKEQTIADAQTKREKIQQFSDLLGQGKKDEAIAILASIDPDLWLKTQGETKPTRAEEMEDFIQKEAIKRDAQITIDKAKGGGKENETKDIWGYDKSGKVIKIGTMAGKDQLVQIENKEDPETEKVFSFDEATGKMKEVGEVPKGSKVITKESVKSDKPKEAPFRPPLYVQNIKNGLAAVKAGQKPEDIFAKLAQQYPQYQAELKGILWPNKASDVAGILAGLIN